MIDNMKRVLITGANSYVGTNVEKWLQKTPDEFIVDTVDTFSDNWKKADFSKYDVVFHVAGIAHVNAKKSMEPLYYKVNTDLTIEIGKWAKEHGVRQFIFMSSMIVYHESRSLRDEMLTVETEPKPNGFYGNSKLLAENGLHLLEDESFKVCILRPPMIYGPGCKGNFLRLGWLATKTPFFPEWHNKRSMLYIDNLAEFVKNAIEQELSGTYFPQNSKLADTVEIARFFANKYNHKLIISRIFNPLVVIGSLFFVQFSKMFSSYYYDPEMSKYNFDYQIVDETDSFVKLEITEANRRMK